VFVSINSRDGKLEAGAKGERTASDDAHFTKMLSDRLSSLQPYNSARYRLSEAATIQWIAAGRLR
jgi:hypothetical protein